LLVDFVRARWANAVVTDLVIDLGRQPAAGALRAAIGRALGDPRLALAYPLGGAYVDDAGRPVNMSDPGPGRTATEITRDGAPLAVLLHDAAVLDDPALVESVAAGAALAMTNARMQARTRDRVDALAASRQRLVEAGETQRRRIAQELESAVDTRLGRIAGIVVELQGCGELPAELLDEMLAELEASRDELRDVAAGLLPREVTDAGLASALLNVAARTPGSVNCAVECGRLSPPVETTLYYVCAEALSNVAKHANASHVRVAVRAHDGAVSAVIEDDGIGGADEALGSGLRGLADRVEATGGRLIVTSAPATGTRLVATIPQVAGTP
jgi:signal transduction histidine kinase